MNGRATRRKILDAAQRLVERDGVTRLTTREIAREAGVAEGTLFKHFARKEDLALAMVLENAPRFKEAVAGLAPGRGSLAGNLTSLALAAIGFSEKLMPLGVAVLADASLLERHRQAIRETGRGPAEMLTAVAGYFEGERRAGRIHARTDPESAALALFGPCFHRAFLRQALGTRPFGITDRAFATRLAHTLLRGLAP